METFKWISDQAYEHLQPIRALILICCFAQSNVSSQSNLSVSGFYCKRCFFVCLVWYFLGTVIAWFIFLLIKSSVSPV